MIWGLHLNTPSWKLADGRLPQRDGSTTTGHIKLRKCSSDTKVMFLMYLCNLFGVCACVLHMGPLQPQMAVCPPKPPMEPYSRNNSHKTQQKLAFNCSNRFRPAQALNEAIISSEAYFTNCVDAAAGSRSGIQQQNRSYEQHQGRLGSATVALARSFEHSSASNSIYQTDDKIVPKCCTKPSLVPRP